MLTCCLTQFATRRIVRRGQNNVTPPTARKWLGRYLAGGEAALADASSRPARSPRAIEPAKALLRRPASAVEPCVQDDAGLPENTS
jgi:hypothetical protein